MHFPALAATGKTLHFLLIPSRYDNPTKHVLDSFLVSNHALGKMQVASGGLNRWLGYSVVSRWRGIPDLAGRSLCTRMAVDLRGLAVVPRLILIGRCC